MQVTRILVAGFFATALASPAFAELKVEIGLGYDQKNPPTDNFCDPFPRDLLVARVTDGGQLIGSIQYCAAYGLSSATGFTDKGGHHYALIHRDTVHASSLLIYDLDIYRIVDGNNFKVLSMPIEETADAACLTQTYITSVVDSPAGGMELRMRREIKKRDSDCDDLPPKNVMFPDAERVIRFDVK